MLYLLVLATMIKAVYTGKVTSYFILEVQFEVTSVLTLGGEETGRGNLIVMIL